jgi:hypothetical protein
MELAVQVPGQLSIAGMTSVGTPGGCQAAVATSEGRVGRQWLQGSPSSNSSGDHPASCGVDMAFVGRPLCERANISGVDFEWLPRWRRSIDVEVTGRSRAWRYQAPATDVAR